VFSNVFSIFQGFFSRAFWFGSFLPVLVVASIHAVIAGVQFPDAVPVASWVGGTAANMAATAPFIFATLLVLAYAMAPLMPLMRDILDGKLLPEKLHRWMREERLVEMKKAREEIDQAVLVHAGLQSLNEGLEKLWTAREEGVSRNRAEKAQLVAAAEAACSSFAQALETRDWETHPIAGMQALEAVREALKENSAGYQGNHAGQRALSKRVHAVQERLIKLISEASVEATHRADVLSARHATALPLDVPQATRFGDARRIVERYSESVYAVRFAFLWPRLQLVMQDKEFNDRLVAAKAQIDFAILSIFLVVTLALWLPVLAWTGRSLTLFLGLGAVLPLLFRFFYELAVQSQLAFGDVMRAAVDRYRLDLLKLLRLPVPASRDAERQLWKRLQDADELGIATDINYRHPATP
jgi:hypothetical protein